jgi:ribosomal protein S18 acetylase RimI-like enzyme
LEFRIVPAREAEIIKPLWQELNKLHCEDSKNWKGYYSAFTFEERVKSIIGLPEENARIEVVFPEPERAAGYCMSVAYETHGEIESIYVKDEYRRRGLGKRLVESAVSWLRMQGCTKIRLSVAEGHESVISFYERLGFCPRLTVLELKK